MYQCVDINDEKRNEEMLFERSLIVARIDYIHHQSLMRLASITYTSLRLC